MIFDQTMGFGQDEKNEAAWLTVPHQYPLEVLGEPRTLPKPVLPPPRLTLGPVNLQRPTSPPT
jgi:hypothetical protein